MKPRKVTRRVAVTARDDVRDRRVAVVIVDDEPPFIVAPADGDTPSPNPPVRQRVRKSRRGGTQYRKTPP